MPRTKTSARATDKDRELAHRIGQRIREARHRAGLTQQQLAGERYTKAYVSALETGIARPSMVALNYLSERLNLPASHFIDEGHPAWTRLEVDMQLAAGEWQGAADGYRALLEDSSDDASRADLLRGLAEALARLDHGKETIAAASEAARLYGLASATADAALARYWLAYGLYQSDNEPDARSLLTALLEQVRGGLHVEPDFEMRLLTSLAAVESRAGQAARALELSRGGPRPRGRSRRSASSRIPVQSRDRLPGGGRLRGRHSCRHAGHGPLPRRRRDLRVGAHRERPRARVPGSRPDRARPRAGERRPRPDRETGDERWMAAVADTEAQVALAAGDTAGALRLAADARDYATRSGNELASLAAMLTEARALRVDGQLAEAEQRFADAAALARSSRVPNRLREVLREWADLRADAGDHRGAYELTSEALTVN